MEQLRDRSQVHFVLNLKNINILKNVLILVVGAFSSRGQIPDQEEPACHGNRQNVAGCLISPKPRRHVLGCTCVMCVSQGENGIVFYLTVDVVDTNCSIVSRKDWKTCEARPLHDVPVRANKQPVAREGPESLCVGPGFRVAVA